MAFFREGSAPAAASGKTKLASDFPQAPQARTQVSPRQSRGNWYIKEDERLQARHVVLDRTAQAGSLETPDSVVRPDSRLFAFIRGPRFAREESSKSLIL